MLFIFFSLCCASSITDHLLEVEHDEHAHSLAPAAVATTPGPGVIPAELAPYTVPLNSEETLELSLSDAEIKQDAKVIEEDILIELTRRFEAYQQMV